MKRTKIHSEARLCAALEQAGLKDVLILQNNITLTSDLIVTTPVTLHLDSYSLDIGGYALTYLPRRKLWKRKPLYICG